MWNPEPSARPGQYEERLYRFPGSLAAASILHHISMLRNMVSWRSARFGRPARIQPLRYSGYCSSSELGGQGKAASKHPAFELNAEARRIVEEAIREVAEFRKYYLIALNVRTTHVHSVTNASAQPERIMDAFKAYSTRRLRENGLVTSGQRIWARHGSTRYLWTEEQIASAAEYTERGQGDDLPKFD